MIGVDVSRWNGSIDWQAVAKAGYGFAFCKASEGRTGADPLYQENIEGAYHAGMLCAPYHFARPDNNEPEAEAAHFLEIVGSSKFSLPAVLDLEQPSTLRPPDVDAWVLRWMRLVDTAIGRPSILYSYPAYLMYMVRPSPELLSHPLWIADYSEEPPRIGQWKEWAFWQHTAKGTVPGIRSRVDLNRMVGWKSE